MFRRVEVVDSGRVEIDGMESVGGAIYDLEPRPLLHGEVDEEGFVYEVWECFECHELVVRFRGPGIDLNSLPQGYHQELDPLVLDNFKMGCSLKFKINSIV